MCECFYYDMLCDVVCLRDVPRYDYQCDQNWQNFATLSIFKSVWLLVIFLTKSFGYSFWYESLIIVMCKLSFCCSVVIDGCSALLCVHLLFVAFAEILRKTS